MPKSDAKCARCRPDDFVEIKMIYDEYPCAPGEGCDLDSIAPLDGDLIYWAMRAFGIDRSLPDARQQLGRKLRKKWRRARPGRRADDLKLAVAFSLSGAAASDRARDIADSIAPQFPNLAAESLLQKVRRARRPKRTPEGGG